MINNLCKLFSSQSRKFSYMIEIILPKSGIISQVQNATTMFFLILGASFPFNACSVPILDRVNLPPSEEPLFKLKHIRNIQQHRGVK